tara:strand:- start:2689 stop:3378 length:690 start_codon:yes stop_codon:yes gene_type:complete
MWLRDKSRRKEIDKKLGKKFLGSGASNPKAGLLKYLGGIPEVDALLEEKPKEPHGIVSNLIIWPKGIEVMIFTGIIRTKTVYVAVDDVDYWTIEPQGSGVEVSKSVFGRALLGGLVLGPLGAVLGGASGVGSKHVSLTNSDNVVTVACRDGDNERLVLLGCANKKIKKVRRFLDQGLVGKYVEPGKLAVDTQSGPPPSIADELMKLNALVEAGVLTPEEFDLQKQRLLT